MNKNVTRIIIGKNTIDPFKFDEINCDCVRSDEDLEMTLAKIIN